MIMLAFFCGVGDADDVNGDGVMGVGIDNVDVFYGVGDADGVNGDVVMVREKTRLLIRRVPMAPPGSVAQSCAARCCMQLY